MIKRRGPRGAKRLDTQAMKAAFSDQQMTTSLGVVRKFPGEDSHFVIDTENGTNEIMVDVELIPSGTRVLCRLGFGNTGVYSIPKENAEVAVLVPYDSSSLIKDSLDFGAIIVGVLDNNSPSDLDGDDIVVISTTRVKILADTIEAGSSPEPLATKADLDALATYVQTQLTLPVSGAVAGPGATPSVPSSTGTLKLTAE